MLESAEAILQPLTGRAAVSNQMLEGGLAGDGTNEADEDGPVELPTFGLELEGQEGGGEGPEDDLTVEANAVEGQLDDWRPTNEEVVWAWPRLDDLLVDEGVSSR